MEAGPLFVIVKSLLASATGMLNEKTTLSTIEC